MVKDRLISFTGKEGCPCINGSAVLATLDDRACTLPDGRDGVLLTVEGPCVPLSFGSDVCLPHDAIHDPDCGTRGVVPAGLCPRPFCYVDAGECSLSTERLYRSAWFPQNEGVDVFYSYTTCDPSFDNRTATQPKSASGGETTLGGVTIKATVPTAYFPPYIYKRNSSGSIMAGAGDEYYDDSLPFEGVLVNYLNRLRSISVDDFNVTYTHGSKASKLIHPASAYTAVVQDIEDGLVDMGVAPFWITGERLKMGPFTVPLYRNRIVLVIPKPGIDNSIGAQIAKVLEPFTPVAWLLIVAIIFVAALLSVWLSDRFRLANEANRGRGMYRRVAKESTRWRKLRLLARLALDAFLEKAVFFCSAGVEQEIGASLPYKVLMFGFGFFILIVIAAYVANLAAFLTRNVPEYIGTVKEVVENGKSICALPALQTELKIAHPRANFVFSSAGKSYEGLVDDYLDDRCDFIAIGENDASANIELMDRFCDIGLVFTDSLIIENNVAFPLRPDLVAGMSYWIHMAEKFHKVTVQSIRDEYDREYNRQPPCQVILSETDSEVDDFAHITPKNLFFPCIFFAACALIAAILQRFHQRQLSKGKRSTMTRPSLLMRSASSQMHYGRSFSLGELSHEEKEEVGASSQMHYGRSFSLGESSHEEKEGAESEASPPRRSGPAEIEIIRAASVVRRNFASSIAHGSWTAGGNEEGGPTVLVHRDESHDRDEFHDDNVDGALGDGIHEVDSSSREDENEVLKLHDELDEVLACIQEIKMKRRKKNKVRFAN